MLKSKKLNNLNERIQKIETILEKLNKNNKLDNKLKALNIVFDKIEGYQKENINNSILIQINDLTAKKAILTYATKEIQ